MLPSMYSGISGLKANQKKLDVVGNNIANSSTTSYKSQRARFEDMISQNIAQASQSTTNTGGVNGKQVGLGVQLAGIDTDTSTGSMQPTSRNLDFAIDGTGYFVVGTGALPTDSTITDTNVVAVDATTHTMTADGVKAQFTRDGSFTRDTQGNLLTSDGLRVYGYANSNVTITYSTDVKTAHTVDITTPNAQNGADMAIDSNGALVPLVIPDSVTINGGESSKIKSISVAADGVVTAILANGATAALGQMAMASFSNDAGLKKDGKNLYSVSANSGEPIIRSISGAATDEDNSGGYGDVLQGVLEMSNVDLAEQFTDMIIASRAFQANGKIISTGDEILQDLVNLKR